MTQGKPVILIVDDEELNLELIEDYLETEDIEIERAHGGVEALQMLEQNSSRYSAVLLDRMMPDVDGMEVLSRIKNNPEINGFPVIMQTAMASRDSMVEGLKAGAYYYLAKPYDREMLLAIVGTALRDHERKNELQARIKQTENTLTMLEEGRFVYRTLEQAKSLAEMLARGCDQPDKVVLGLTELMINAVEHGNLGITYNEKSRLTESDAWQDEIMHRLEQPEYRGRLVSVDFSRSKDTINVVITDQGEGFDWDEYLEIRPERAFDTHGRGIAMARTISFEKLEFRGKGNVVCATISRRVAS